MKITAHFITVLLLTGGAAACTKESAEPQESVDSQNEFFVKAEKDGGAWTQPGTGTYVKSKREFYVSGGGENMTYAEYLHLGFSLPSEIKLSNKLIAAARPLPAEWLTLIGGDGITNSYATADAQSLPSIQITRLDTVQKIMEGRFEATLLRNKHYTQQMEFMRFTNGSFRVRYQEVP